jgi:threonylcarbamoyladenosine tRNA methylthiotransferase MtaB
LNFPFFQLVSFGCKVNQAEGEALAAGLRASGLAEAAGPDAADLVVVNSCAVTGEAARQCRQRVRHELRRGAAVVVTGCAAHPAAGDAALHAVPGVLFLEPDKDRVAERLREMIDRGGGSTVTQPRVAVPPEALPARARAMLKVQDGCPAGCAYCIVPKVRPAVWSLAPDEAARRVADRVAAGFREIVLCGIQLGLYGLRIPDCGLRIEQHGNGTRLSRDPQGSASLTVGGGEALVALLDRLVALPGDFRLRLSSLEPMEVAEALLARLAAAPDRLCPHLHLPLQSGSDAVLARMGRPYAAADFLAVVERVRRALPQPAVTTDVLVGFPGETQEDFAETLRVCRAAAFSRMHVFPFSRRPGTAAAEMADPVPAPVIRDRRRRAAAVGEELAAAYRRGLVGREARVVIERVAPDGAAGGLCERYVRVRIAPPPHAPRLTPRAGHGPGHPARPAVPGPGASPFRRRDLVRVRLVRVEGDALIGEVVVD